MASILMRSEGALAVAAAAMTSYVWFRKYEPSDAISLVILLGLVPTTAAAFAKGPMEPILATLVVAYLLYYGVLLLLIAAYRLSPIHPLHHYPGPFTCKLSKFWLVYLTYKGKQHVYFHTLHRMYGPVVRVGPNELSIVDVELIPSIMGTNGMPKGPMWDGRKISRSSGPPNVKGNLVGARNKEDHAEMRRVWNRAFTTASVKKYEPIVIRRASQLVEELKRRCSQDPEDGREGMEVDLARWVSCFSFDFMGDFVFGGAFELMRDGDKEGLLHTLDQGLVLPAMTQHIPWCIRAVQAMPFLGKQTILLGRIAYQQVTRRLKEGSIYDDLFYHLSDEAKVEKERPSFHVIMSNSMTGLIAGSDTAATALSSIFFLLCIHSGCFERLRDEVDDAFPPRKGEPTDTAKLAKMEYLNAVINEALRIYPPAPTTLQRAPTRGSGGHLLGPNFFVPEGTAVYVPPFAIHRDPRYFSPDPERFWPERWLPGAEDAGACTVKEAFIPFSTGPANCVGKPLALMEMRMVVAYMIQAFDFRLQPEYDQDEWERKLQDFLVLQKGMLPVILSVRQPM
ncbi:cytochrome P450 [Laetiporus sulphureus 93-53]|uniref:Cytochrome P450 n=1 Tax=Laetiporus sulphureus 93-53 TaxID=1314785 RepID=A0A165EZU0_9APHY|nr:cytochrome P450 [Laetiporus sulphureus 93-53]KZT08069.1 cytochrome P450 [Laetiporus sulphureus 93-53]